MKNETYHLSNFWLYLRYYRKSKKMKQKQLSQFLGITQNTYSRYETNARVMPLNVVVQCLDKLGYEIKIVANPQKVND